MQLVKVESVAVVGVALPADRLPGRVYLARLAPGSRRTMEQALGVIMNVVTGGREYMDEDSFPWWDLRYQHTAAIRTALASRYSPATTNKTLCALRGVLKEAWRLGLMAAEDYQRASDVAGIKSQKLPAGRALSPGEIRALFVACGADQSAAGARDAAILGLLYGGGLRRSEIRDLNRQDYDRETGGLVLREAKGSKDRTAYAANGTGLALEAWLDVRGDEPGPLFVPVNKAGRVQMRRMSTQAVYGLLQKRVGQGAVSACSPHDLRRTFISDLLDAGADITTVSKLAGHASVTTTARYDRRGEAAKRKAVELLHVPYSGSRSSGVAFPG